MTEQELDEWYIRMAEAHTEAAPDEAIDGCNCKRCFEAQKMYDGIS
jgi:hypothetical protein